MTHSMKRLSDAALIRIAARSARLGSDAMARALDAFGAGGFTEETSAQLLAADGHLRRARQRIAELRRRAR